MVFAGSEGGICDNSILCVTRLRWIHKRYNSFSGKLKSDVNLHSGG